MRAKNVLCTILIILTLSTNAVHAGGLQDMWNSNVTSGGNIDTQNRHAFIGGSASYRTPIKSIQLYNYSPPKMTAGCSGADLYMGSFSYINKDEIVNTLKAIMNNAQGLLFQAAIEFVSPMISGLMTKFKDLADKYNISNLNSCEIATAALGDVTKFASNAGKDAARTLANNGVTDDWLEFMVDPAVRTAHATDVLNQENISNTGGNLTWKALKLSGVGKKLDFPMLPVPQAPDDEKYINEIVMSFVGTFVSTSKNSADPLKVSAVNLDPLINIDNLINGSIGLKKYVCDDNDCKLPTPANIDIVGAREYVDIMMYGDPAWLAKPSDERNRLLATVSGGSSPVNPGSIAAKIAGATNTSKAITTEQTRFLKSTDMPVVALLAEMNGDELTNIKHVTDLLSERISLDLVYNTVTTMTQFLRGLESSQRTDDNQVPVGGMDVSVEFTTDIKRRIEKLEEQASEINKRRATAGASLEKARAFVNGVISARLKSRGSTYGRG